MRKAEFIRRWVETVCAGRRKNFRDITPAEEAAVSVDDTKTAARVWRKYLLHAATPEQLEGILSPERLRSSEAGALVVIQ